MPAAVRDLARLLLGQIADLREKIAGLDGELRRRASVITCPIVQKNRLHSRGRPHTSGLTALPRIECDR